MNHINIVLIPHKGTPEIGTIVINEDAEMGIVNAVSLTGFVKATNGIGGVIRKYYTAIIIQHNQLPAIGQLMYDFAQEEIFTVDAENLKYAGRNFCVKVLCGSLVNLCKDVANGVFGTLHSQDTMLLMGTLNSLRMS